MTSYFQLQSRDRLAMMLIALIACLVLGFWGLELSHSLQDVRERETGVVRDYQERMLERKAEELRDTFSEIYRATRTISLLPMIRSVKGENRRDPSEDVVAQGRLSIDAHRTVQQIYVNLQHNVRVSEVYYVLDGFVPGRDTPFFMYDDLIVMGAVEIPFKETDEAPSDDMPPEHEEDEYRHFPTQLEWFRRHAPTFAWSHSLDSIPVRLSPPMRTCDNTQYVSLQRGNVRDTLGFVFAFPVYSQDTLAFKGMITAVMRINALEAILIGAPFVPITAKDAAQQAKEGWAMPSISPFRLSNESYDISVYDRRNAAFADVEGESFRRGRRVTKTLTLHPGAAWELTHFMPEEQVANLVAPHRSEYLQVLFGRLALLLLLFAIAGSTLLIVRRSRRELLSMAHYDALTDLPNRRLFLDYLNHGVSRCDRRQSKLALLFLDVAGFNAINDALGNQAGDRLLIEIGRRLQTTVRGGDVIGANRDAEQTVARLGGDQFTVVCEDIDAATDLSALVGRILGEIARPYAIHEQSVDISMHVGVAVYPDDAPDGEKLLICADSAMHESRRQAVPHFIFNAELRERGERLHRLSSELAHALERNEFVLFYQPKASLVDGRIVSLEALLRWRHPRMGLISPVDFIPILERGGGIIEVGAWVIEQSCRDLARLSAEGYGEVLISANVSVRQLRRGNLHETVVGILERNATDPARLVLEVTESTMMENLDEGRQLLMRLTALGIRLAIDDFGTGYSSLTYLQNLPLSYLKLDKSFIDGMVNPRAQHIVRTVIALAKGLALKTIAEGIETPQQRDALAEMGCDIMQGYLLSKPRPLDDILLWLRAAERS